MLGVAIVVGPATVRADQLRDPETSNTAPVIEIYTMGVGELAVEKFGHAAVCVREANSRNDLCYNYGTTDFADPVGMGWGFIRGRSRFWVSVMRPGRMLQVYKEADRTIWLQRLALAPAVAQKVADQLRFDALEANRYYHYHHFTDNCTTRVRDIVDVATGGMLSLESDERVGPSFRDLSRAGFAESYLMLAGLDLILGRAADHRPSEWEGMFLPQVFRESVSARFGVEPVVLHTRKGKVFSSKPRRSRLIIIALAVLLSGPLWLGYRRGRFAMVGGVPALVILSILGLLIWSLAIISPLPEARFNENLLLFFPGDVAILFLGEVRRHRYARVRVVIALLATALAGAGLLMQPLWSMAILPVLILLPIALPRVSSEMGTLRPRADRPQNHGRI